MASNAATLEESPVVQVVRVCKRYGEHQVDALRNVSLEIQRGKFLALMGPSGCGKSTLLNCIGGLDVVSSGTIIIAGQDLSQLSQVKLTELRRDKIGFVFQFFNLLSTLTVRENVELPLELTGQIPLPVVRARADALLTAVGLEARAGFYPGQLSGGELQRVAVTRAIIHHPQVILADEPTGNLDTESGQLILKTLQQLCREQGHTVLMATHSPDAASFADRTVHMKDGVIVEGG
jgi:putative ABC transport system ATP-binding protein